MKNILDQIVAYKHKEVAQRKAELPLDLLKSKKLMRRETISLKDSLKNNQCGIIAEHKRASPSKGLINDYNIPPAEIAIGYEKGGASAISVLTDEKFFQAQPEDIHNIRRATSLPILRKEFIIDNYQIIEAKSLGADAILLIAAVLSKDEIQEYTRAAHDLGLEVLLEIHEAQELEKVPYDLDVIGINNRNLKTFEVDFEHSLRLCDLLPKELTKISESGISDPKTIQHLQSAGFEGFLIGETFMKTEDPGTTCENFIAAIEELSTV